MIRDFSIKFLKPQMFTDKHRFSKKNLTGMDRINRMISDLFKNCSLPSHLSKSLKISVFICANLWLIFLLSCNFAPTDLRNYAPVDSLVYLETNDLQNTLNSITENETFKRLDRRQKRFLRIERRSACGRRDGF